MESYTERSDKLEKDAENMCHPTETVPYNSCYESLMEEERLRCEARELQDTARSIREKFKEIVEEGLPVPNGTLLRKAIISARKEKISFSIEQLLKACEVLFEDTPYIVFKSPKESRLYVIVLFWACDFQEENCSVLKHLDAVRKDVAVNGVEIKIDIDAVFAPPRYVLYLMDNCSGSAVRNRHLKLGNEEDKQLAAIRSILCNPCRRRITPTRVPLKRPCILQATIEEKKERLLN